MIERARAKHFLRILCGGTVGLIGRRLLTPTLFRFFIPGSLPSHRNRQTDQLVSNDMQLTADDKSIAELLSSFEFLGTGDTTIYPDCRRLHIYRA